MLFPDYADQYAIPKDKTLFEMQAELGTAPVRNNEFIRLNAARLGSFGNWSDDDLKIFWACMDVYAATGKNYFANYFCLVYRIGERWDFSKGVEAWFAEDHDGPYGTADEFIELVDYLRFFDIGYYDNIPFSEFKRYANIAHSLYEAAKEQRIENDKLARAEGIDAAIKRYFNFDQYVESEFNELANRLILKQKSGTSIDEILSYSKAYPKDTYIVVLKRGKTVCYTAQTVSPLQVIGSHHKKLKADSACVDVVNPAYADDLVLYLKLFYDLMGERAIIHTGNRKYGTLKKAIFAYNRGEGIPKKKVMAAIERDKVRTYELRSGMILVDKLDLHRALFPTTK